VNDQRLNDYVIMIGRTLADQTERDPGGWMFGVLDTDVVNAYSGPGGYVFVTRGALRRMHDESELAGIMGHEVGHVIRKHGTNAAARANLLTGGLQIGQAATGNQSISAAFPLFDFVGDVVINKGWGRAEEGEADADGARIAAAAGYDPNGLVRFLQRMQTEQGSGANVLSTHPGLAERVQSVSSQIQRENLGRGVTNQERFASYVNSAGGSGPSRAQ
jgi:predicted Zn-dependent protease